MVAIDRKSGDIVLRIVFDGPPEAGKTSTVDHLASIISLQRRNHLARPGTTERRTEFFDWLDFAGGFLDGRRVRCQLISVPGQSDLLHRRRYLLESADVVVFVADASASDFSELREAFATTLRIVERSAERVSLGVVLQANKQDLPGARAPAAVAAELALPTTVPALGTSAVNGTGIMQTLILAVRLATDRARALGLASELELNAEPLSTPEQLYGAMLLLEPPTGSAGSGARAPARPTLEVLRAALELPARPAPVLTSKLALPPAAQLPAGCIWPPVTGRSALAAAQQGALAFSSEISDYAPAGCFEVVAEPDWLLHSGDGWRFEREADARWALLSAARACDLARLPEGRALFVAEDQGAFRLWMLTKRPLSLLEQLAQALESADADAVLRLGSAIFELEREAPTGALGALGLAELALQRGGVVALGVKAEPGALAPPASGQALRAREQFERALGAASEQAALAGTIASARLLLSSRKPG